MPIEFKLSGNPEAPRRITLDPVQIESVCEIADCKDVVTITTMSGGMYDVLATYEEAVQKWQASS